MSVALHLTAVMHVAYKAHPSGPAVGFLCGLPRLFTLEQFITPARNAAFDGFDDAALRKHGALAVASCLILESLAYIAHVDQTSLE